MPSKRPLPAENQLSASSSSSSGSEEEEVDSDEQVTTPPKPSSKKTNPPPTSLSKSPHDPISDSSKPNKPLATASTKTPVKRPLDTRDEGSPSRQGKTKKKKKKVSDLAAVALAEEDEAEKKSGDDQKKLFQRLWTDEDEIVILKGMINFKKKGMDPSAQVALFFDSISNSLRPDVNKSQLHSKIRTLRRKYYNAVKKAKPGQDPHISKPHEEKVFHLSKKVWGGNCLTKDEDTVGAGAASVSENNTNIQVAPPPPSTTEVTKLPDGLQECEVGHDSEYPYLSQSLAPRNWSVLPGPPQGLVEIFSKRGWSVMGSLNAKGFDKSWRKVMIAETKAYLQRVDLVREQTQAMLDALESSTE